MSNAAVTVPGLTLLSRRGAGASGEVYSARRESDGWACAVKLVGREGGDRFAARREIDVLTAVRAPSLVRLYDVLPASDGRLALVLDLVDGGVLRESVAERGRLAVRETLGVLGAVFEALQALHAHGIAHGDVSAGNVLLTRDGRAVLGDLGSARLADERLCEVSVTRGFAAPEVRLGRQPTTAGDIYAAGAVAWLMLTGSVPGDAYGRVPLTESLPDCPGPLVDLVAACLSGEAESRPDAAQAAAVCHSLGPDEPLPLADGHDLGGRLTHRLRSRVAELEPGDLQAGSGFEPGEEYRALLAALPDVSRGAAPGKRRADPASGRHRSDTREGAASHIAERTGRLLRATSTRVLAAVLAGTLAGAALWWGLGALSWFPLPNGVRLSRGAASGHSGGSSPQPSQAGASAATSGANEHPASARTTASQGPVGPSGSIAADDSGGAVAALPVLLAARAHAYAEADPQALSRCYLPGSRGLREATAEVEELRRADVRFVGLAYAVRGARLVPPQDAGSQQVRVAATVVTSAYRAVVGTPSSRIQRSSVREGERGGTPLTFVLRRENGQWRIAAVED